MVKRSISVMVGVAAVVLALGAGYWVGRGHGPLQSDPGVAEPPGEGGSAQAKGAPRVLYYRNPMGLPDTSPTPKKDSMGMDYIPVYQGDEPDGDGAVTVSPARLQTLGVKTALAEMRELDAAVRAVGRVEVNERLIHEVAPRFEGWIERLHVNASGDPVKRGQPLFSVYSPELVSAQKELVIAQGLKLDAPGADPAAREAAQRMAAAAQERLANWQIATPRGPEASRVTFNSPATGVVLEKKAVEGMRFMPGTAIYRIADLSVVWVIADVYEQDLSRVKVGEGALVSIEAFPDRHFNAKVSYLYPTVNPATRTTAVRLELDNRAGLLRPGMFAHVALATGGRALRLAVPKSAVIDTGERQVVLRVAGEGKYQPQPVKVGLRGQDHVEILQGLEAGAEVVVAANFLIDAESNLKAALATFTEPKASGGRHYETQGSIDALDAAGQRISMNHEAIAALQWPAMTMEFGLASPGLVQGILPGQPVRFSFEDRGDGEFVITRMEKMNAPGTAPAGKGR